MGFSIEGSRIAGKLISNIRGRIVMDSEIMPEIIPMWISGKLHHASSLGSPKS